LVERLEAAGGGRVAIVGGVAANSELRAALPEAVAAPLSLCTDNAAMIASAARYTPPLAHADLVALDAYASASEMATAEPASHLRENPFELAQQQLRKVGGVLGINENLLRVLQECKKSVVVSVPTQLDDGSVFSFAGYRVTHNDARGPSKGGI